MYEVYEYVKEDLVLIEELFYQRVKSESLVLSDALQGMLKAGGKRLRLVLLMLVGRYGQGDITRLQGAAAAIEMVHMGTLIHDDMIDESYCRRGQKTLHRVWNEAAATAAGDFLFARAWDILVDVIGSDLQVDITQMFLSICEVELHQLPNAFNLERTFLDYLRCARKKTALFFAAICRLGAAVADLPANIVSQFYHYGYLIGMAFQIIDDLGDFVVEGNITCNDLRYGNITLPALYAYAEATPQKRLVWDRYIRERGLDTEVLLEIDALIRNSTGVLKAKELAQRFLAKADSILNKLPDRIELEMIKKITLFFNKQIYHI